jgi:hypothetical protein
MRGRRPKAKSAKEAGDAPGPAATDTATLARGAGPEDAPLQDELGQPALPGPVPIPDITPDQIPAPGPGEAPDTADDTANVPLDILVWLKGCKAVLLAEGFKRDPLRQARKPSQVWGVVRQEPDDMQIHVRAFKDGRLESEHELSNRYVQHLWSHRWGAHEAVKDILARHGMPTHHVSETFVPITGTKHGKVMPKGRTKTTHILAWTVLPFLAWLAFRGVRRAVLRRR